MQGNLWAPGELEFVFLFIIIIILIFETSSLFHLLSRPCDRGSPFQAILFLS